MASGCAKGCLGWILGYTFQVKELSSIGPGCQWLRQQPGGISKMSRCGIWGHSLVMDSGSDGLMVELGGLRGPSHHKRFQDSVID